VIALAMVWHATIFRRLPNRAKDMNHQQPAGVLRPSIVKGDVFPYARASLKRPPADVRESRG
jgi:hypothetical protein